MPNPAPETGDPSPPRAARRHLPDPAICRAKFAGFGAYVDCLVESPIGCQYAQGFGNGFFCNNPERAQIVARTEAAAPPADKK